MVLKFDRSSPDLSKSVDAEPHRLVRDGHDVPGLEQALQEKERASWRQCSLRRTKRFSRLLERLPHKNELLAALLLLLLESLEEITFGWHTFFCTRLKQ